MYPILAGFIAFSIAGRAALAPAMIGAMVGMNEEILGTKAGDRLYWDVLLSAISSAIL